MSTRAGLLIAAWAACSGQRPAAMAPAGSEQDDGYGDLAQQSARLRTHDGDDPIALALQNRPARSTAHDGAAARDVLDDDGDDDDSDAVGARAGTPDDDDDDDGDSLDAAIAPAVPAIATLRDRPYQPTSGLTGIVEGTVTGRGSAPPVLVTACGKIAGPAPRADHALGGVLVTIEPRALGRVLPSFARTAAVGGTVTKRGCRLAPTLQIVTPLPASVTVHGDAAAGHFLATQPASTRAFQLQPAGRVSFSAQPGVTRIEATDGSISAAWIVASNTPYYAITDDDGRFRIGELAPGTYHLTFWRAPPPTVTAGKLSYGDPATTHRFLRVERGRPARLDVQLAP